MKRKGSLTLLAALLLVTLCGCGGGGEASSGAVSSVPTEEPEVKTAEIVMDFAGDINLDDSWYVMDALYASGGTISDAIDPALPLGLGEVPYGPLQVMHLQADTSALQEDTGWRPATPFEEGIRETIEWVRKETK